MGRKKKIVEDALLLEKRAEGKSLKEISRELNVSIPTLSRRIAFLKHEKNILTKYRQLQGLQLSALQARILEAADSHSFESASLLELINAFSVLKKAEISIQGKESFKVWGLLDHLQALESLE